MNVRLQQVRRVLEELQLEALLISNAHNRKYMTGFTGSAGYVVITASNAVLLTDFRYKSQAPKQATDYDVRIHKPQVIESIKELLEELHISKLGFEQHDLTFAAYQQYHSALGAIDFVATDRIVENIRMLKDSSELELMQASADLADRTFTHIVPMLKPGMTEREVALEMEFFMRSNGATSSSFEIIVASGERSALPHGIASDRVLQSNEFVKLDFGAYYNGYCSDITRTVFLGKPSAKHLEIYNVVLEAQMHALAHIRPGMTGHEADALARDIITRYGYGEQFGHGTGHGLGMEIHEDPRLTRNNETILAPGMVVTVEPGIYIPDFGGVRIEDSIIITATGMELLTHSTKEFIVIE